MLAVLALMLMLMLVLMPSENQPLGLSSLVTAGDHALTSAVYLSEILAGHILLYNWSKRTCHMKKTCTCSRVRSLLLVTLIYLFLKVFSIGFFVYHGFLVPRAAYFSLAVGALEQGNGSLNGENCFTNSWSSVTKRFDRTISINQWLFWKVTPEILAP